VQTYSSNNDKRTDQDEESDINSKVQDQYRKNKDLDTGNNSG